MERLGRVAKRLADGPQRPSPQSLFFFHFRPEMSMETHLCYLDESGTPEIPGTTSHFVLAGISIPIHHWKDCERELGEIRKKYGISDAEIHTAWLLRKYVEQKKIAVFEKLDSVNRRVHVEQWRRQELLRLQKAGSSKAYKRQKKNFRNTCAYIHLTHEERVALVREIAKCVSEWGFARVFAECIDKIHFSPQDPDWTPEQQAFEQIVTRFEKFLGSIGGRRNRNSGLLIHDNNETVAKKHTAMMKRFHRQGTFFTQIRNIIETPFFVNSELTGMVGSSAEFVWKFFHYWLLEMALSSLRSSGQAA